MKFRRTGRAGVVAGVMLLALSACGGTKSVAQADVEKQAGEELAKVVGQKPDKIECPGDLKAEVGTEMRCELFAGGESIGLTVTVTSVDGSDVKFDVNVDQQ